MIQKRKIWENVSHQAMLEDVKGMRLKKSAKYEKVGWNRIRNPRTITGRSRTSRLERKNTRANKFLKSRSNSDRSIPRLGRPRIPARDLIFTDRSILDKERRERKERENRESGSAKNREKDRDREKSRKHEKSRRDETSEERRIRKEKKRKEEKKSRSEGYLGKLSGQRVGV